jgi:aromatic ring-opening dioxygenase catalytic subunit (LigB family)
MNDRAPGSSLPTLYIPHGGGPCFFMDWTMGPPDTWARMADWLRHLADSLAARPKAVLVISAHWEEVEFTLTGNSRPPLIYDYSGFPEHTYHLKYPAPGSTALAERVRTLLEAAGIPAKIDPSRGFDHGVFIPFKLIYPSAEIPIVQLSLKAGLDPASHIEAGRAIEPLRRESVLIVGSGMSYHNMRGFFAGGGEAASERFDAWLTQSVCERDPKLRNEKLRHWEQAPAARASHPREEHLLPLMVAAGAAEDSTGRHSFSDQVMNATVSAYQFG